MLCEHSRKRIKPSLFTSRFYDKVKLKTPLGLKLFLLLKYQHFISIKANLHTRFDINVKIYHSTFSKISCYYNDNQIRYDTKNGKQNDLQNEKRKMKVRERKIKLCYILLLSNTTLLFTILHSYNSYGFQEFKNL